MFEFFLSSNNNTSTEMESSNSMDALSPAEITGLVLGIFVLLVGLVYCSRRQCCDRYRNETGRVAPQLPEPGKNILHQLTDIEGKVISAYRVYPDGSILDLPIDSEDSSSESESESESKIALSPGL